MMFFETRKVGDMGFIVLPRRIREQMDIQDGEPLDIYMTDDSVLLKKHIKRCCICRSEENLEQVENKEICRKCIELCKQK